MSERNTCMMRAQVRQLTPSAARDGRIKHLHIVMGSAQICSCQSQVRPEPHLNLIQCVCVWSDATSAVNTYIQHGSQSTAQFKALYTTLYSLADMFIRPLS